MEYTSARTPERVTPKFDRSIIGIPSENDEYTRGLTFFDPFTGVPSVHLTSEGSEDLSESLADVPSRLSNNPGIILSPERTQSSLYPCESPPYEPSRSSNNSSSRKVFTPQSASDFSGGLHPRLTSPKSVISSDSESSNRVSNVLHTSVSACASAGDSEAAHSQLLYRTPVQSRLTESRSETNASPTIYPSISEPIDPLQDMSDPRDTINIDWQDIRNLEKIMSFEHTCRQGMQERAYPHWDRLNAQNNQLIATPHSELAQGSERRMGLAPQAGTHPITAAIRTPKNPRSRSNPMGLSPSTSHPEERERAEEVRMMRRIGSCLPCLVNHEKVSEWRKQVYLSQEYH